TDQAQVVAGRKCVEPCPTRAAQQQRRRGGDGHGEEPGVEHGVPRGEERLELRPVDVRPHVEIGAALEQQAEPRDQCVIADATDRGDGPAIDLRDDRAHIENIEPSFIARPMSPLTFSLPDMNSICPDCLPDSMSSQSWAAIDSVRFGLVAGPGLTMQAPSLTTAFHVPTPSPLTSYWMVALVPDALSGRKRPPIAAKVSWTVGMLSSYRTSRCGEAVVLCDEAAFLISRRGPFAGLRGPTVGRIARPVN